LGFDVRKLLSLSRGEGREPSERRGRVHLVSEICLIGLRVDGAPPQTQVALQATIEAGEGRERALTARERSNSQASQTQATSSSALLSFQF